MIIPKFYGVVKKGQLEMEDNWRSHLWHFEGKEVELTIKPKYKRRTSGQPDENTNFNGYWWGVIIRMIADEMGEIDQDYVHAWVQMKVGNFTVMPDGEKVPKGTRNMTGGEFAEMCSRARMWASTPGVICEKGLYLPEPHEVV